MNNVVATIEPVMAPASPVAAARPRRARAILGSVWRWTKIIVGWIPLTLRGVLVATGLFLAYYHYAMDRRDQIILGMGICGLSVMGVLILNVTTTAIFLRFKKRPGPASAATFDTGCEAQTGYELGMLAANPLIRVEITWDEPGNVEAETVVEGTRAVELITPKRRGEHTRVARTIKVSDVLGLGRIVFRERESRQLLIRPAVARVRHIAMPIQFKAGEDFPRPEGTPDGDLVDLRKYGPGDPLKRILWKTFARTGRLVARQPEKALAPTQRVLAYLVAGEADEATAGLLRSAVEGGWFGENYLIGADGVEEVASEPMGALRVIIRSMPTGDAMRGVVRLLDSGPVPEFQSLIAFVPARPGPWLAGVAEALGAHGQGHAAVIGVDRIPAPPRGFLKRMLLRKIETGPTLSEVLQVKKTLEEIGVTVQIIDRQSGDLLNLEPHHG